MELNNRYEIVSLVECRRGNPNGDPDRENRPRFDGMIRSGLMSPPCVKRKIRNYIDLSRRGQEGMALYIAEGSIHDDHHERVWKAVHAEELAAGEKAIKAAKTDPAKEAKRQAFLTANYIDQRFFGGVSGTGDFPCGSRKGPVQIAWAESVDPIEIRTDAITRCSVTSRKAAAEQAANRTMGRIHTVRYALYEIRIYVLPDGVFREADLELLLEALQNWPDLDRSAARPEMAVRKLVAFKHESRLGNARACELVERVKAVKTCEGQPRSFADYEITVDDADLPAGVTLRQLI